MSIRALAADLYKAQQRVDQILKQIDSAAVAEENDLNQELRFAQKELEILRKMLDGEKESGEFRKKFDGFGSS
jgi:hypothetical protein